jgi:hypothetical protein
MGEVISVANSSAVIDSVSRRVNFTPVCQRWHTRPGLGFPHFILGHLSQPLPVIKNFVFEQQRCSLRVSILVIQCDST